MISLSVVSAYRLRIRIGVLGVKHAELVLCINRTPNASKSRAFESRLVLTYQDKFQVYGLLENPRGLEMRLGS